MIIERLHIPKATPASRVVQGHGCRVTRSAVPCLARSHFRTLPWPVNSVCSPHVPHSDVDPSVLSTALVPVPTARALLHAFSEVKPQVTEASLLLWDLMMPLRWPAFPVTTA